jgi:hypothetical protein
MSDARAAAPSTLFVPGTFNGPPARAHGGYVCGRLAALAASHLTGQVVVALHLPIPLETPLEYRISGARGYVAVDGQLAATVSAANRAVPAIQAVSAADAVIAQARADRRGHPFPTCFACGTDRPDGLRLLPGPAPGRAGTTACAWSPDPAVCGGDGRVVAEIVWSALDCPGGWTCDLVRESRVLTSMTAVVAALPHERGSYVIGGQLLGIRGRTATTATAIFSEEGTVLARALAGWATVAALRPILLHRADQALGAHVGPVPLDVVQAGRAISFAVDDRPPLGDIDEHGPQ